MSDPVRWSRTPGLRADLARALETARAIEPPPGMQRQVLEGVLGAAGAAAAGSAAASAATAKAATGAGSIAANSVTTIKLAAWVLLGVGALGAAVALQPARPSGSSGTAPALRGGASRSAAPIGTRAAAPAPRAAAASLQQSAPLPPEPNAVRTSAPAAAARGVRQPGSTSVRSATPPAGAPAHAPVGESQWVLQARACLRAGDLACALASLDAADRAAAPGVLAQERALLRIRALHRLGRRSEATQLAGTFLDLYPDSPYSAEARAYSQPAENRRE